MHDQPNAPCHQFVGLLFRIVGEIERGSDFLAVQGDVGSRFWLEANRVITQDKSSQRCWRGCRKDDVVGRSAASGVRSTLEKMQTSNGHPLAAVVRLVLRAPRFGFCGCSLDIHGSWILCSTSPTTRHHQ